MFRRLALAATFLLFAPLAARAADPPASVGRLGYIEGSVSQRSANQPEWSFAPLNYPVSTGLSLWTEPNARAEIQLPGGEVRLDGQTALDVLALDDTQTQVRLNQGTLNIHVHALADNAPFTVQTPKGQFEILQPGTYHIDAGDENLPTRVAVIEGAARFDGAQNYIDVQPGEAVDIAGPSNTFTTSEARHGAFDDWALARERREVASESARYVPQTMPGYRDLDTSGSWAPVAD